MGKPPKQKPGKSEQSVSTPWELIRAIEYRFGKLQWDLAASHDNTKAPNYITEDRPKAEPLGYSRVLYYDSLTVGWNTLNPEGLLFLNPPYSDIAPWAKKCLEESLKGARIFLLTPLTCSKWYCDWILGKAYEIKLRERITFEGHNTPYPKDLALYWFNCGIRGSEVWSWRSTLRNHENLKTSP